jgi:hypothetical protein
MNILIIDPTVGVSRIPLNEIPNLDCDFDSKDRNEHLSVLRAHCASTGKKKVCALYEDNQEIPLYMIEQYCTNFSNPEFWEK